MSDCCSKDKDKLSIFQVDSEDINGLICYCFKKSKSELLKAIQNGSEKTIVDEIKSKMKDPGCFCKTANPSGKCCLSDIQIFIKNTRNSNLAKIIS
jgi:hypothetical protein